MNYDMKKEIADKYLMEVASIGWDDLGDINSLHDAETIDEIHMLCMERLDEEGFHNPPIPP